MKIETKTVELRILTASKGMVLTNGETYSDEVYLGVNDNPDNWNEITEEEYNEIQKDLTESEVDTNG